eukprot:scaffold54358_cov36-Cyclotella_meneghiniana.AAC.6
MVLKKSETVKLVRSVYQVITQRSCLCSALPPSNHSELSNRVIDWHAIRTDDSKRSQFNTLIKENLPPNPSYTAYNVPSWLMDIPQQPNHRTAK